MVGVGVGMMGRGRYSLWMCRRKKLLCALLQHLQTTGYEPFETTGYELSTTDYEPLETACYEPFEGRQYNFIVSHGIIKGKGLQFPGTNFMDKTRKPPESTYKTSFLVLSRIW